MNINLYKTTSENNVVYKSLSNSISLPDCYLKENTSVISPVIFIQTTLDLTSYNYAYISSFGNRYYYITDITFLQGNNVQFDCKVDVLMSFQKSIYNSTQYVERQEDSANYNLYIPDENFNFMANDNLEIHSIGTPIIQNNTNFILTTVG